MLGRPREFKEAKEEPGDAAASLLLVLFKIVLISATWVMLFRRRKHLILASFLTDWAI